MTTFDFSKGLFSYPIVILVGGLDHFLFFHILGTIIPTDELIFFRGMAKNHQPVLLVL
jgi:hypothetical protein